MTRFAALRLAVWLLPLVMAYLLVATRRRPRSLTAALVLGLAWNSWSVLAVNIVAIDAGWWSFDPRLPSFMEVAIEAWFGWVVLWTIAGLIAPDRPAVLTVVGMVWLDLIAMPLVEPIAVLGDDWVVGEAAALAVAFLPGLALVRWTLAGSHLYARLTLQMICAGALFVWLVVTAALSSTGGWTSVFALNPLRLGIVSQGVVLAAAIGVRAAIEFAREGRGTPLPYDPPTRLITSGPYSYVRNPMQLSMVLVFLSAGIGLWNGPLILAAVVAVAYGAGLAEWHEDVYLVRRYGDEWTHYRAAVRSWIPRLRPIVVEEATLFVAFSCDTCSSIGRWFLARKPVGLSVLPAEDVHDAELRRVTYASTRGRPARGVAAIARALEHIHLGWALVGWILALPVVSHFAQLVVDVFGPGPQVVAGRHYDAAACAVPDRPRVDAA